MPAKKKPAKKSAPTKKRPAKKQSAKTKPAKAAKRSTAKAPAAKPKQTAAKKKSPTGKTAARPTSATTSTVAAPAHASHRFVRHDLMCTEPARAAEFYRALFGWTTIELTVMGTKVIRLVAGERVVGAIMPFDAALGWPSHWVGYVDVADVDATCARVRELSGTVCVGANDIPPGRFALCEFPSKALFSPFTPKQAIAPGEPAFGEFCWDELVAPDVARAKTFYAQLFDWTADEMRMNGMTYVVFKREGRDVAGAMQSAATAEQPPSWLAYVRVADVNEALKQAMHLGATLVAPPQDVPHVGRFAIFRDPTGATLGIFQLARG